MLVVVLVTACTVKGAFVGSQLWMDEVRCRCFGAVSSSMLEPGQKGGRFAVVCCGLCKILPSDHSEDVVIHVGHLCMTSAMLAMAVPAVPDVRVKGSGLSLEYTVVIGVADDAVDRLSTFHWGVTGATVVVEEGMGVGERAGIGHALPGGGAS